MKFEGLTSDQVEELSRYIRTTAWRLYKNDFWKQNDYEDVVQIGWAVACEKRELFMERPFKKALACIGVTFGYAVEQSTGYYGHGKIKPYAEPFTDTTNKLRKAGVLDERSGFENIVTRETSDEWLARRALLGAFLLEYCERTFPKRGRVQKEVARAWLENLDINDGPEKYGFSRAAYHDAKKRVVAKLRREIGEGATIRGLRDFLRDKKYEADRKCAELWRKNRGGVRHNERGAWRFMDAANAYEREFVR